MKTRRAVVFELKIDSFEQKWKADYFELKTLNKNKSVIFALKMMSKEKLVVFFVEKGCAVVDKHVQF